MTTNIWTFELSPELELALRKQVKGWLDTLGENSPKSGYVLVYDFPRGWIESINYAPRAFVSGTLAVPVDANFPIFMAHGGDGYSGAREWRVEGQQYVDSRGGEVKL